MARGWRPVLHTDGAANEEREPDTRFEFSSAATVAAELSLVAPCPEMVADYISAMLAGWSPSTTRDISATEIAALRADEAAHLRSLAFGEGLVTLADGSQAPRLPGKTFWMWDGGFCGSINFRHVPGTEELPSHVSGHIGYSVVPWKRRRGYGTKALALMLASVRDTGLARVRLTCDETNMFSRAVIERNGGVLIGREPHEDGPTKLGFWLPVA
jgi:predicted acetyltransferase